jgi:hypothetical protein
MGTTVLAMLNRNSWTEKAHSVSTPARTRRIIAEVAKKALKDYYRQSCVNLALKRKLDATALILQSWARIMKAKKILLILRCKQLNLLVRRVQTRIRMYLAKEKVQSLRWERELKLKKQSAVKIQLNVRAFLKRRRLENFRRIQQKSIFINRQTSAILIQSLNRGVVVRNRRDKQISAVLKIQMRVRITFAIRNVKYVMLKRKASMLLFLMIIRWWNRRKIRRNKAARIVENLVRRWKIRRYFACRKLQRCAKEYLSRMIRFKMRMKRKEMRHKIIRFIQSPSPTKERYIAIVLAPIPDDWIIVTLDFNRMAVLIQMRVKLWFVNRNACATIIQTPIRLWLKKREMSAITIQKYWKKRDYNQKCSQAAEIIQRSYRRYFLIKLDNAVLPIQRVRRRSILVRSWKATVYAVMCRAHLSAEIIQCFIRMAHAIKKATDRRNIIREELSRQIEDGLQKSFNNQCWDSSNFKGSSKLNDMICPEDYDDFAHEFGWDYDHKRSNRNNQVNLDGSNRYSEPNNNENYKDICYSRSIYDKDENENTEKNETLFTNKDTEEISQRRQTDWAAGLFKILDIGGSDSSMPPDCLLPQRWTLP